MAARRACGSGMDGSRDLLRVGGDRGLSDHGKSTPDGQRHQPE